MWKLLSAIYPIAHLSSIVAICGVAPNKRGISDARNYGAVPYSNFPPPATLYLGSEPLFSGLASAGSLANLFSSDDYRYQDYSRHIPAQTMEVFDELSVIRTYEDSGTGWEVHGDDWEAVVLPFDNIIQPGRSRHYHFQDSLLAR